MRVHDCPSNISGRVAGNPDFTSAINVHCSWVTAFVHPRNTKFTRTSRSHNASKIPFTCRPEHKRQSPFPSNNSLPNRDSVRPLGRLQSVHLLNAPEQPGFSILHLIPLFRNKHQVVPPRTASCPTSGRRRTCHGLGFPRQARQDMRSTLPAQLPPSLDSAPWLPSSRRQWFACASTSGCSVPAV